MSKGNDRLREGVMLHKNRFGTGSPIDVAYAELREQHVDTILFMRIGDFFECFNEDAMEVADVLNLPLYRVSIAGEPVTMLGFPYHMAEEYVARLVEAGRSVTLAEPTHGVD